MLAQLIKSVFQVRGDLVPMIDAIIGHSHRADMIFVWGLLLAILAIFRDLILAVGDLEHLVNFSTAFFAGVLI